MKRRTLMAAMCFFTAATVLGSGQLAQGEEATSETETTEATIQFQKGGLSLDNVPGAFQFGNQEIVSETKTYQPAEVDQPYVQVTDNRGTGNGWHVTVQAGPLTSGAGEELKGSTITLTPEGSNPTDSSNQSESPNTFTPLTLDDHAQRVFEADTDQGMGSWQTGFTENNVTLEVPAGSARATSYSTEITWTLASTP
ncbi:WxL domain-containing protein [Shouchella shacheensis]|uniref:WxL domain-containing protein n=1 Tax=Shouchella shacheensis TaxID=1649580 RepID=UPI00073FAE51|nr:WxL domain-containing protein [Shouchella shacheensis]